VPRFCGGQLVYRDERRDGLAANSSLFAFFLWRALAQSHPEGHSHSNAVADRDDAAYGSLISNRSAGEQSVLLRPVERQIELGQTGRRERVSLPTL